MFFEIAFIPKNGSCNWVLAQNFIFLSTLFYKASLFTRKATKKKFTKVLENDI